MTSREVRSTSSNTRTRRGLELEGRAEIKRKEKIVQSESQEDRFRQNVVGKFRIDKN